MSPEHELYTLYLDYTQETESPRNYHRWVLTSLIGTIIGRNCYVPFGPWKIYPNQYILLVGPPGVRKGSAISIGKKLLREIDYPYFGPDRAAKEAIWYEMAKMAGQLNGFDSKSMKDEDIFALDVEDEIKESIAHMYICTDEFTAFTGYGNEEFMINLTNLWDNLPVFSNPKLTSSSVTVYNPTFNILSGSTQENIADAFPKSVIGSGFTARTLLIHGSRGKKIPWPPTPNQDTKHKILDYLIKIENHKGAVEATKEARELLEMVYHKAMPIADRRFEHFFQRRQTHLLKQCLVNAISRDDEKITVPDVMLANTALYIAEREMPLALGHFGKSLSSSKANTVLEAIYHSPAPLDFRSLWKQVAQDCAKEMELKEILRNLVAAEKIQSATVKTKIGKTSKVYLPKRSSETSEWQRSLINYDLVSEEEKIH